jgi:dihydroorotate dehydrogenase (fumarate)
MQSTLFCDIQFPNLIMNAPGPNAYSIEDLQLIEASSSGAIVTKSFTLSPRLANHEPNFVSYPGYSLNNNGFGNIGYSAIEDYALYKWQKTKPLILSIAGLDEEEYLYLISKIQSSGIASLIELNLSCPNTGKVPIAYDFEQLALKVHRLNNTIDNNLTPVGLKLPPYNFDYQWDAVAEIINGSQLRFVTSINSIPNGISINPNDNRLTLNSSQARGGIGGTATHPIALSNVLELRKRLDPWIEIIGVGGVESAQDVIDFSLCGAKLIQSASGLWNKGWGFYNALNADLEQYIILHNLQSIHDVYCGIKNYQGDFILKK